MDGTDQPPHIRMACACRGVGSVVLGAAACRCQARRQYRSAGTRPLSLRLRSTARGQGSGILQTLQNYCYDIALLVVASMFVGVCYYAYTRYSEIHTGRAT